MIFIIWEVIKLLKPSKPNTISLKKSFSYKGAKVWHKQNSKHMSCVTHHLQMIFMRNVAQI